MSSELARVAETPLVSFIVPCLNEEANVAGALDKLSSACEQLKFPYEIIVVDDGSKDQTSAVVKAFQERNPAMQLTLLRNETPKGVARNFFDVAFVAKGDFYRLVCGDDVEPVTKHIAILSNVNKADLVVPYCECFSGRAGYRKLISTTYTGIVNLCSGYGLNYYNGLPLYRRYDVMRFSVEATGFGYQAELITRLMAEGRSVLEVGVPCEDRAGGTSLSVKNFISVAHSLLKMCLRRLRRWSPIHN
jgi:glycosyltransferase involved in cell wall biosynthesis